MDAQTYGRMVERGGYATGGVVQNTGFTLFGDGTPETRWPSACAAPPIFLVLPEPRDPDDGTAGVPARI